MPARKRSEPRNLALRKQPVQTRSKESIRKILDGTHRLLRSAGPSAVTTPAIAAEAGVSVGSLYHFFPNKEAIILALYEEKLERIRDVMSRAINVEDQDWQRGFREWLHTIKREEAAMEFDIAMNEAMEHFPGLSDVSRAHAVMAADMLVIQMKALGSRWPEAALFDLAIHIFYLNSSLWLYWSFSGRSIFRGVDRLADAAIALMTPALDGSAPPPGPYASRTQTLARTSGAKGSA